MKKRKKNKTREKNYYLKVDVDFKKGRNDMK